MKSHHYIALRLASKRAEDLRALTALAEVAFRDLMAAHGFDSTKPYRWNDAEFALEEVRGDTDRSSER